MSVRIVTTKSLTKKQNKLEMLRGLQKTQNKLVNIRRIK